MRYVIILVFLIGLVGCGLSAELLRLKASTGIKKGSSIQIIIEEEGDKNENITNGNTTPNGGVFKYYDKNERGGSPFYFAYYERKNRVLSGGTECPDKSKRRGNY